METCGLLQANLCTNTNAIPTPYIVINFSTLRANPKLQVDYRAFYLEQDNHRLWLRAENNILSVNLADPTDYIHLPIQTQGYFFKVSTNTAGEVQKIYAFPWLAAPGFEVFERQATGQWTQQTFGQKIKGFKATQIVQYQEDEFLVLTDGFGLVPFDGKQLYLDRKIRPSGLDKLACIDAVMIDSTYLLVATRNQGLWLYNLSNQSFIKNWVHTPEQNTSLASNLILGLHYDDYQNLWVGLLNSGVDYSVQGELAFQHPRYPIPNGRLNITSVVQSISGEIWLSTKNNGVFLFDQTGALRQTFSQAPELEETALTGLKKLSTNHQGQILGISREYILQYDQEKKQWKRRLELSTDPIIDIHPLFFSQQTVVKTVQGLAILQCPPSGECITKPIPELLSYKGLDVGIVHENSNQDLYVPFQKRDLLWFKKEQGAYQAPITIPIGAEVFCYYNDEENKVLWLGTSKGVMQLTAEQKVVSPFSKNWEIGQVNVHSIQEDADKNLWIATTNGLWKFDQQDQQLFFFGQKDGLMGEDFSIYSQYLSKNKLLWLGHKEGLTFFDPKEINPYPHPPQVHIDQLLINNIPYQGDTVVSEAKNIHLNYLENDLSFDLVAVGYHQQAYNRLRYLLHNYDTEWTTIMNGGSAKYNNLPPGDYRLDIIAINANGVESSRRSLSINIQPPFWETLWFRLSALVFIIGIIALLIRYFVQKKLREEKIARDQERALHEERNRIADDLHDELGRELSDISAKSIDLLYEENEEKKTNLVSEISQHANISLDKMEEILWILESDFTPLDIMLEKIELDIRKYMAGRNMELTILIPDDLPSLPLGRAFRNNLLRISKEAMHNIVKYAQARQVDYQVQIDQDSLHLFIADNGVGMDLNSAQGKGRGLNSMRKRTEELKGAFDIQSALGAGTKINIKLPIQANQPVE